MEKLKVKMLNTYFTLSKKKVNYRPVWLKVPSTFRLTDKTISQHRIDFRNSHKYLDYITRISPTRTIYLSLSLYNSNTAYLSNHSNDLLLFFFVLELFSSFWDTMIKWLKTLNHNFKKYYCRRKQISIYCYLSTE